MQACSGWLYGGADTCSNHKLLPQLPTPNTPRNNTSKFRTFALDLRTIREFTRKLREIEFSTFGFGDL